PDLLAAWRRIRDWSGGDWNRARLAVLDACVQLEVAVPPEELQAQLDRLRIPSTILLARAGRAGGPLLLEQYRKFDGRESSLLWLATGHLLAGLREPGFLVEVLAKHRMLLSVTVRLPEERELFGHDGLAPAAVGTPRPSLRSAMP